MTDNTFEKSGSGDQNIGQGKGSIGQQINNYFTQPLKPKTLVIASLLGVGLLGTGFAGYHLLAPPAQQNSISITGDKGAAVIGDHAVVNNSYGISPEVFAEYAGKLKVTESALAGFFKVLEEQQVPPGDLDAKLREIAAHYKELLRNWEAVQSADPQVVKLKAEAKQAIDKGRYDEAEELLNNIADQYSIVAAEAKADNARLQRVQLRYAKAAEYWRKAAALLPEGEKKDRSLYLHEAAFDLDRIAKYKEALTLYEQNLVLFREIGDRAGEGVTLNNISQIYKARGDYATALTYLERSLDISQKIGDKSQEGATLNNISQIYDARGDYAAALTYLERSLDISQKIGDRAGEGATLNNISQIYDARGDYAAALTYLERSLDIFRDTGSKSEEGTTLNNISQIYDARGDYAAALKYLERSLDIRREIGDRAGEGTTLNNISGIHWAQGDYTTALKYLERSLDIFREIGDRRQESITNWNIGWIYKDQGDLAKAEQYMSRAVQLAEEIGHPKLEEWREGLAELRAAIKAR